MEPEQTQEEKPMSVFELCRELHLKGFPQQRFDEAYYYIRPDLIVRMDNLDALKTPIGESRYASDANISEFIYAPRIEDFIEYLGMDLQNVVQTVRSGWFAYTNSTLGEGITTRSGGTTMWLALANVILARYLEKDKQIPVSIPDSENVQDSLTPPENGNP